MLDKTLHSGSRARSSRSVLTGKYLAGLIASVLIFSVGAALCSYYALASQAAEVEAFCVPGRLALFW